jgi:hypothetical protein
VVRQAQSAINFDQFRVWNKQSCSQICAQNATVYSVCSLVTNDTNYQVEISAVSMCQYIFMVMQVGLVFNPSMPASVQCTDLQFFTHYRPQSNARSLLHLRHCKFNPSVLGTRCSPNRSTVLVDTWLWPITLDRSISASTIRDVTSPTAVALSKQVGSAKSLSTNSIKLRLLNCQPSEAPSPSIQQKVPFL